jgi:NADH-quinone oxidoreductase subunit G
MRIVPHENNKINQTWISDRDRFSYEGLYHSDRLEKPMVRVEGQWKETDWQTALDIAAARLRGVMTAEGADQIGALASPNSTVEELYLLQKWMRQLGTSNIDHRLRETDFSDQEHSPLFPGMAISLGEMEESDVIVLIGSHISKEQPIAGLRVRQAVQKGARVIAINMMDYDFNFTVSAKKITAPHQFVEVLADIAKSLSGSTDNDISAILRDGKKVSVLVGIQAFHHPKAAHIRAWANEIARMCNGTCGFLTEGANAAGAWMAGAIPHRGPAGQTVTAGMDVDSMWKNPRKAYVLLNVEPELDCVNAPRALTALEQAECVISLAQYKNPVLMNYAHVILPVTPFTETAGTFVNAMGDWQRFNGVAKPLGEARPAWKVLRVLGNLFHCEGFDFNTAHEVRDELKDAVIALDCRVAGVYPGMLLAGAPRNDEFSTLDCRVAQSAPRNDEFSRIGEIPIYAGDSLQRRAKALQATQMIIQENLVSVRLASKTAQHLQVNEADIVTLIQQGHRIRLPVLIDERVPESAAFIAGGILATHELSELYGPIEIQKV